jgi:hypothetical protein
LLSERLGQRRDSTVALTRDPNRWGNSSSQSIETVPVLGAREIMSPPFGPRCGIVHLKSPELGLPSAPIVVDLSLD